MNSDVDPSKLSIQDRIQLFSSTNSDRTGRQSNTTSNGGNNNDTDSSFRKSNKKTNNQELLKSNAEQAIKSLHRHNVATKDEGTADAVSPKTKSASQSRSRSRGKSTVGTTKRRSSKVSAKRIKELVTKYVPQEYLKTAEDISIIETELQRNFVFNKKPDHVLEDLIKAFEPIGDSYQMGDEIITQHDVGDYFYIMGKDSSVAFEVDGTEVGSTSKVGSSFGELALLYSSPRKATVRVTSNTIKLYRVDHMTFRYILQSRSKFKALYMQAVTKIKAVNRLLAIVDLTASSHHNPKYDYDDDSDDEDSVSSNNDGFHNSPMATPTKRSMFLRNEKMNLLGGDDDEEAMDWQELSQRRSFIRSSFSDNDVTKDSFSRSSMLGEGQFGEVWLVQPNFIDDDDDDENEIQINKEEFALKIQSKVNMSRASSSTYSIEEAIQRECDVLSTMCHPFIVDFVRNFEDEDNIYMVMGAIKGKELWEYIHREQDDGSETWISGFGESHAKFYAFVITDTLNYMHRQCVVHRDIKPENILIDGETGYPVLVDFGFAKKLEGGRHGKTYTLCGTPKYTAPEIISNDGHGYAVDHWALGVVIYEMVSGENPFYYDGISDLQLFDDICNAEPYPIDDEDGECSQECKDIIEKLLDKNPNERLMGADIIEHKWFAGMDIHKVRKQELEAPGEP